MKRAASIGAFSAAGRVGRGGQALTFAVIVGALLAVVPGVGAPFEIGFVVSINVRGAVCQTS